MRKFERFVWCARHNIFGLDEGIEEIARKFSILGRRVLSLIPNPRDAFLSRVAGVLAPVLSPRDPGSTQREVVCISNVLVARYPCWIENKAHRELGWRLHLVIVNGPVVILFRCSVNARPMLCFGDDLLVQERSCRGSSD